MLPPVSVIIPTYNRCRLLPAAIDSVLSQDYPSLELVVVDDGSTDTTHQLLAGYGKAIRVLTQENRGAAASRNAGIRAASHDFLAFLDSDDQFAPGKLARQAGAMVSAPEYLISHTDEVWFRQGQLLNQKRKHARSGGDLFARSLKLCVVGMSTVMARREFFAQVGLFDEELPCCEDYDLWLRAAWRLEFLHVPEPLTIKHGGRKDQLSRLHRVGMDRYRIKALLKLMEQARLYGDREKLVRRELARKCRIYGRGCLKHGRQTEGERYLALAARYG
jgi:glycosyltransferase involved in cell wall biosynthesis